MGAGMSQEEAEAYLKRQDELIAKLSSVVASRKGKSEEAVTSAAAKGESESKATPLPAWMVVQQNKFDVENSGKPCTEVPQALSDEFYGLLERARAAERRRTEPPVESYERELPNVEWSAPTPEEAAALRETRPWLAVMNKPAGFEHGTTDAKPPVALQLEHVYGYRSSGIRNNLRWLPDGEALFTAGGVAVVHNIATNTQCFFQEHQDEITSIAVSKDGTLVATGDQGKWPSIYVWDVATRQVRAKLSGNLRRAIAALAFSDCGTYLGAVGLDDDHTVAIYDWKRGRLAAEGAGSAQSRILEMIANRETASKDTYPFVTVGEAHASWWGVDKTNAQRAQLACAPLRLGALGDVQTFTTALSTPAFTVIGTQNGELYVCQDQALRRVVDAHHGAVLSIAATTSSDILVTGGYDGYVSQWSVANGFRRIGSQSISAHASDDALSVPLTFSRPNSIRAVDVRTDAVTGCVQSMLIGTVSGGVYTIEGSTTTAVLVAHGGDLSTANCVGELTGVATHPGSSQFASIGETTLFLWDTETRRAIKKVRLPSRGQCVAWSPSGSYVVVGLHSGKVLIYNDALVLLKEVSASLRRVQCLRFSADGTILAVGTADNLIQLYDASTGSFDLGGKLSGAGGVPLSIDFSIDGKVLQSSTQAYETVYFDLHAMALLPEAEARAASNIAWSTFSSLLGWSVQGIWPQGSELNDVTSVSRSKSGTLLASAEESGVVKVFQFPCVGGGIDHRAAAGVLCKRPDSVRGTGHGGKVTQVQWLNDDRTLISAGGEDLSCFQWKVVAASSS